jgi:hypothetical protein
MGDEFGYHDNQILNVFRKDAHTNPVTVLNIENCKENGLMKFWR